MMRYVQAVALVVIGSRAARVVRRRFDWLTTIQTSPQGEPGMQGARSRLARYRRGINLLGLGALDAEIAAAGRAVPALNRGYAEEDQRGG